MEYCYTREIREDCFVAPGLVWSLAEQVRLGPATLGYGTIGEVASYPVRSCQQLHRIL